MLRPNNKLPGGVTAGDHLDRSATQILELPQKHLLLLAVESIAPRMGEDRNAAAHPDPVYGLLQARPAVRHAAGFARHEKFPEYRLHVARVATFDEKPREMRPADQIRIGDVCARAIQTAADPGRFQLLRHALRAVPASATNLLQPGRKFGVRGIDVKSHNVQGLPVPAHGNLDTVDAGDRGPPGMLARLFQTSGFIVVGQRQDLYAPLRRARNQRRGTQQPVGTRRMAMQIELRHRINLQYIMALIATKAASYQKPDCRTRLQVSGSGYDMFQGTTWS